MTRFCLMSAATVLVATLSFYGCSESSPDCTPGSEGCVCSEGQCLSGLMCLSNTCVDPGGAGGSGGTGAVGGGGSGGDPCANVDCSSDNECIEDGTCDKDTGECIPGGNKDPGEECSEDGGSFCDGTGDCVECNDPGHCPDAAQCMVATCDDNTCGEQARSDGAECDLLGVGDGVCDDGECVRSNVVVGAFDTGRGGILSFADSSSLSQIRNEILTALPEVTFATTDALTTAFLNTVDVLMISSGYQGDAAIAPLTASEQAALRAFVESGGGALLFADNDSFGGAGSDPANESLIDAFGLDVTGTLEPGLTVTVINPSSSPITDGPFGLVTSVRYWSTGYFDNLGPDAQSLATLDVNGEPGLALIPRDTLAPGSGDVLLFSDMTLVVNSWITPANVVLVKNALHHVGRLAE